MRYLRTGLALLVFLSPSASANPVVITSPGAGSIDENALNQLSLVINLTKHIQIKAGGAKEEQDPDEYAQYFPSFMWVVRDFTL